MTPEINIFDPNYIQKNSQRTRNSKSLTY